MGLLLILLVLFMLFGGLGFVSHALWLIALALLVVWLFELVTGRLGGRRGD